MSVSAETVFSVLIGGLISGLVTWLVAHLYFRKQDARAERVFEVMIRTIQRLVLAVESEAQTRNEIIRDDRGRIMDVKVTLIQGFPPTVTTGTVAAAPTSTKQVQQPGSTL